MNKVKLLTIAVIGLLILNFGVLGVFFFSHPPHGHPGEMPPPFGAPKDGPQAIIIERLHFDEAQQKSYQVLIDEHKKNMNEINTNSRALKEELYALLKSVQVDSSQTNLIIQKIGEGQKQLEHLNFNHFKNIKAICKPNQVNDFNELANELSCLFFQKNGRPPQN